MAWTSAIPVIGKIIDKGLDVVDQFVEDKDKANQLKAAIKQQVQEQDHEEELQELKAQAGVIKAEATGESTLQRIWRPVLMFVIMGLLVFNGAIVPLGEAAFQVDIPTLEAWNAIPKQMWSLLTIGMGGYIGGRSAEKVVQNWKGKGGKG